MTLQVNTRSASLFAQRNVRVNLLQLLKSQEHLATGQKINRSGDDPVRYAISETLLTDNSSYNQGIKNAQDGMSMLAVASGGLETILENMQRMREITIQAASDSNSQTQRDAIAQELRALTEETQRIANTTSFNGIKLLDGSLTSTNVQLGSGTNASLFVNIGGSTLTTGSWVDAQLNTLGLLNATAGFMTLNDIWDPTNNTTMLTTQTVAQDFLNDLDTAITFVTNRISGIGILQNQLDNAVDNLSAKVEGGTIYNGQIRDADIALDSSNLIQQNVIRDASLSIISQVNQLNVTARNLLLNR